MLRVARSDRLNVVMRNDASREKRSHSTRLNSAIYYRPSDLFRVNFSSERFRSLFSFFLRRRRFFTPYLVP